MCVAIPPRPNGGSGGVGRDRREGEKYQIFRTLTIKVKDLQGLGISTKVEHDFKWQL